METPQISEFLSFNLEDPLARQAHADSSSLTSGIKLQGLDAEEALIRRVDHLAEASPTEDDVSSEELSVADEVGELRSGLDRPA